jgi:hypothetical protein
VAVPENNPSNATAWANQGVKGATWAVGGLATDGNSLFAATGNTFGATDWAGGDAILRLGLDDTFSGNPTDFFAPSNWLTLDSADLDLGGEAPILIDVPGATPSQLVVALGDGLWMPWDARRPGRAPDQRVESPDDQGRLVR